MEGRGLAVEQTRIVFFPGLHWVQTVQRCLYRMFRVFSPCMSALTEAGMGVCWREGKGHLRWACWNLFLGFHFRAFLLWHRFQHFWMAVMPCTLSERSQSLLLVTYPSAAVRWREKQDQPQWEAGPVPGVFAPCCTGGLWGVVSHSCCSWGLEPLWSTSREFAPDQAWNQPRTVWTKKYFAIECVAVVGCRSELSQLWHTNILERLGMSQGFNHQSPGQHLSEQNVVTEV